MSQKDCSKSSHTLAQTGKRKKRARISTCPASNSSTESVADSAYEEKTGSHLTSKTSSPYSDRPHPPVPSSIPQKTVAEKQDRNYERGRSKGLNKDDEISDTGSSRSQNHQRAQFTINPTLPSPKPEQQSSSNPTPASLPSKPKPPRVVLPNESDLVHERAAPIPNDTQVSDAESLNVRPQGALSLPELAAAAANDSKSWLAPDDVAFSSFSTISDHFHDSKVSLESSFLKGIRAPRQSRNTDAERSAIPINSGSGTTPQLPLESTRIQDFSSHKPRSSSDGETMSIAVNTRHSTSVIETLD